MSFDITNYKNIVFFTGAGMSAESGVPTYRGSGGIWHKYNWEEFACQEAFDRNPTKVLDFHELRRKSVLKCQPHKGHNFIAELQKSSNGVTIVTQNIDGMHQRIGTNNVIELHGSLWRLRCDACGIAIEDIGESFAKKKCDCGKYLRPDIVWFDDMLNPNVIQKASDAIQKCDLFISIGTSGVVWPAAGFPQEVKSNGAYCIEINTERTELSYLFDEVIIGKASEVLTDLPLRT
ncbi:MAG: NAD-dependent deacylase [Candidatus Marinimicrobia bacterium]|nr:NAD-dependent deacylase [Candidatus Neomarinimicrobiota bacterium]